MAKDRYGTITSHDFVGQHRSSVEVREEQNEFFALTPERRLMIDFDAIKKLPEYRACLPAFEWGGQKFFSEATEQMRGFVYEWLKIFFEKSSYTMWRSRVYGNKPAAEALAALANRLGFRAYITQPWGDGEDDYALVVDCEERGEAA